MQEQPAVLPDPVVAAELLAVAWFMWMSWTPLPGRNPKTLSRVAASGPHRWPNAQILAAGSAAARSTKWSSLSARSLSGPGAVAGTGRIAWRSNRLARMKSRSSPPA